MYKLTIFKQDGGIYWVEHFNLIEDLNKWLSEEKTRPYWDDSYYYETESLVDQNTQDLGQQDSDLISKRNSAKQKLKVLGFTDDEIMAIIGF
jgi:hypothetical protein